VGCGTTPSNLNCTLISASLTVKFENKRVDEDPNRAAPLSPLSDHCTTIALLPVPVHYIVFSEGKTWHEAKSDCEARGFYFAKIRNKAENELFVEAARFVLIKSKYS